MDFRNIEQTTDVSSNKPQDIVTGGGNVIPPPNSQQRSIVGLHWLRCSFPVKHLAVVEGFLCQVWDNSQQDQFGLWSYTDRFHWVSGASLNYDKDPERSSRVHQNRATLDVPGRACDELTASDLTLLLDFLTHVDASCSRIDVFFDDYQRIIEPKDLQSLIESGDYSGFRQAAFTRSFKGRSLSYDCAMFGGRGGAGHGKYLRVYDKYLESHGEFNCVRWECEFSQEKANSVFRKLSETRGDLDAFATLCGSLIAGCIAFVKRTGDKNVKRLERYEFWREIVSILGGEISIRVRRKPETITGKLHWIERGTSPSLACLQRCFRSHEQFFHWLWDVLDEADGRMSQFTRAVVANHERRISYDREKKKLEIRSKYGIPYVKVS